LRADVAVAVRCRSRACAARRADPPHDGLEACSGCLTSCALYGAPSGHSQSRHSWVPRLPCLHGLQRHRHAQTVRPSFSTRRFEQERRSEVASALYSLILQRFGDTPAADAIRARSQDGRITLDRSGRTELLVWGTLYGLWLGVAAPLILDS